MLSRSLCLADVPVLPDHALAACNLNGGCYKYLADLLALDWCRPSAGAESTPIPKSVNVAKWRQCLVSYPDKPFADWVVRGFEQGFRVGFNYASHKCSPARRNISSAKQQQGSSPITWKRKENACALSVHPLEPPILKLVRESGGSSLTSPLRVAEV